MTSSNFDDLHAIQDLLRLLIDATLEVRDELRELRKQRPLIPQSSADPTGAPKPPGICNLPFRDRASLQVFRCQKPDSHDGPCGVLPETELPLPVTAAWKEEEKP